MDPATLLPLLALGFALGLAHALDADHVIAVTTLAGHDGSRGTAVAYCARWALGHGFALLALGGAVLTLGLTLPVAWAANSEGIVGGALIALGAWTLASLRRRGLHIHIHGHDGLPPHAHWHRHAGRRAHHRDAHRHRHAAMLIGGLHGAAGFAPVLALLPLAHQGHPLAALTYLILYSLGVFTAMIVFGGVLGTVLHRAVTRLGARAFSITHGVLGIVSLTIGTYMLVGVI